MSRSGAQQRTLHLHRALARLAPVDVLIVREGDRDTIEAGDRPDILARLTWKQAPLTLYKYATNAWVNDWCQANLDWSRYAMVVGRYVTPITKVDWPKFLPRIVDCDDAFYRYPPDGPGVSSQAKAMARGQLRVWQTRVAIKHFDHAFFCTDRDRQMFGPRSASILPNISDAPDIPPDERAGQTVLIVGSLWYAPNRIGVDWFLDECWPAIASRARGLTLRIVGQADPVDRQRWERHPRTEVPGFVDDLRSEYGRSLFAVAPVHHGGGTCIKFLEAASYRRPCVITRHTYEGYRHHFQHGQATLVARNAADMVRNCVAIAEDHALGRAIADRAYSIVRQFYTADSFDATVASALRPVLNRR